MFDETETSKGHSVVVSQAHKCDLCSESAAYDGKTIHGPWAWMCEAHFQTLGIGTGVGRGQRLVVRQ